jgi:uncharacterized protein DUF4031
MSVYVDPLFSTEHLKSAKWRYSQSCHLTSDSHDELMAFARRLGLKAAWLQHGGRHSEHFDLTVSKRAQAVSLGAKELTMHEAGEQLVTRMRAAKAARDAREAPVTE